MNDLQRQQHRVDVACGYALGAYLGVTVSWLAVLFVIDAVFFIAMLVTIFAGFFGLLRTLFGLPLRLWVLPLSSLVYIMGVFICMYYNTLVLAALGGTVFSIAFAPLIYRLYKNDFAKTVPAWVCKNCGYTLLGLTEPTCPECGQPFDLDAVPKMGELPQE